jgi:hypothetical protein
VISPQRAPAGRSDWLATRARLRRHGTFLLGLALALSFAFYPLADASYGSFFLAACGLALLTMAMVLLASWDRLPDVAQLLPVLSALAVAGLLRQAGGGALSGYAPLVLAPILWLSLGERRSHLVVGVCAVAATLMLPIAVEGGSLYPRGELRRAGLLTLFAATFGLIIQSLLASLREQARRRQASERQLKELQAAEINDDIVQALTAAKFALAFGEADRAEAAIDRALASAKATISTLLRQSGFAPGGLRREAPMNHPDARGQTPPADEPGHQG